MDYRDAASLIPSISVTMTGAQWYSVLDVVRREFCDDGCCDRTDEWAIYEEIEGIIWSNIESQLQ